MNVSDDFIAENRRIAKVWKDRNRKKQEERNAKVQKIISDSRTVRHKPDQQEKFVSQFVDLDSWLLFSEAIPISFGFHPVNVEIARTEVGYVDVERLARSSVGISLEVVNPKDDFTEWRVLPSKYVSWLEDKELEVLNELKKRYLEPEVISNKSVSTAQAERHAKHRESIYVAIIAVLANYPEDCRGKNGLVMPARVEKIINDKSEIWFGYNDLPLSSRVIREMISKAIKTAC